MNSRNKLLQTRSTVPRVSLLHFMVDQVQREGFNVLDFVLEFQPNLKATSKYSNYLYSWPLSVSCYYKWTDALIQCPTRELSSLRDGPSIECGYIVQGFIPKLQVNVKAKEYNAIIQCPTHQLSLCQAKYRMRVQYTRLYTGTAGKHKSCKQL